MILKKPYAFLIRYFKIIHIILAVLVGFLSYKNSQIFNFFNDLVSSGYYTYTTNIASMYITPLMYIVTLLIIIIALAIYFLMKQKDKPTKYYLVFIGYYILMFILFTITYSILYSIETSLINTQLIRAVRDLSLLLMIPQYYFLLILLLRGIGFDVKKFNFRKDLEELEISEKDNEEFEFVLGNDAYKLKRNIRRTAREFKYYIIENRFVFSIIIIMVLVSIITTLYYKTSIFEKKYNESDKFTANNMIYEIDDSFITNLDYSGNIITSKEYFVIIKFNIKNNNIYNINIESKDYKLDVDGKYYYPDRTFNSSFVDLGIPNNTDLILANSDKEVMFIYRIPTDKLSKTYNIKVVESIDYSKTDLSVNYKYITIKPKRLIEKDIISTNKLDSEVDFTDSYIPGKIKISNMEASSIYRYYYDSCTNNNCVKVNKIISANNIGNVSKFLYLFKYTLELDKNSNFYKTFKTDSSLFNNNFKLRYTIDSKISETNLSNVTPSIDTDSIILEGNLEAYSADKIDLVLTIRNKEYIINIK